MRNLRWNRNGAFPFCQSSVGQITGVTENTIIIVCFYYLLLLLLPVVVAVALFYLPS